MRMFNSWLHVLPLSLRRFVGPPQGVLQALDSERMIDKISYPRERYCHSDCYISFDHYETDFYAPTMKWPKSILSLTCPCVCVCLCFRLCVPESCPALSYIIGLENNLAQMIIMTRGCVACKDHVDRSKVKVTVHTLT